MRGFSLLELIVTLTISGILAALAIPYFAQSEVDATWFRDQVTAAIRYAQRQAVAQRHAVFVVVGTTTVDLCYDAGCTARVQQAATGTSYSLSAPGGVVLTSSSFSFDGLGRPNPLTGVSFNVGVNPVVVNAETGYVQ